MKRTAITATLILLLVFLVIPSLRPFFKYTPYPELLAVLYTVCCAVYLLALARFAVSTHRYRILLDTPLVPAIVCFFFALATFLIYPIADARKNFGGGSTADDAMIEPALTLLTDAKLYEPILYSNVPISPGPGWIIQNAPFAILDIYWLMSAFYTGIFALCCRLVFGSFREANLALLSMLPSLLLWDLMVKGHDLVAVGFCFSIFICWTHQMSLPGGASARKAIPLALALGVFATSRIVFLFFPLLLSVFLLKFNRKTGLLVLCVSLLACLSLHGYFFFTSEYYQPLHLLGKGANKLGMLPSIIGAGAAVILFLTTLKHVDSDLSSWLDSVFICLAFGLGLIAFATLIDVNFAIHGWEGANYLVPVLPVLALLFACSLESRRH